MTREASGTVLCWIADSRKAAFAAARAEIHRWIRCHRQPLPPGQPSERRCLSGLASGDQTRRRAARILPRGRLGKRRCAAVQRWRDRRRRLRQQLGREREPWRGMRDRHHQIHEPHARQEAVRSGNGAKRRWLQIAYDGESQEDWHGGKLKRPARIVHSLAAPVRLRNFRFGYAYHETARCQMTRYAAGGNGVNAGSLRAGASATVCDADIRAAGGRMAGSSPAMAMAKP
jgi:hypothetical protein